MRAQEHKQELGCHGSWVPNVKLQSFNPRAALGKQQAKGEHLQTTELVFNVGNLLYRSDRG